MSSKDNQWLIVKDSVILTPYIEPVIVALDPFFEKHNLKAFVTSGLRDSNDQLRVIRGFLKSQGLSAKYAHAMICKVEDKNTDGTYVWQLAWSNLLNNGVIINPPEAAVCLMNYISPSGNNMKGNVIGKTPHASGKAFNIGGGNNGIMDELAVLAEASKQIPAIKDYLAERTNNALHINVK